jgi:hypothetical protein
MSASPLSRIFAGLIGAVLSVVSASAALSQEPLPWRDQGGGYGSNSAPPSSNGYAAGDAYSPRSSGNGAYAAGDNGGSGDYGSQGGYRSRPDSFSDPGQPTNGGGSGGYGEPYAPPPPGTDPDAQRYGEGPRQGRYYEQNEIVAAGHGFFGAVSKGLAGAVEYAFKSQGRPNGYILGEDAGGAFVVGLRYGEGTLYTKDAGDHKVFWQGPSFGYDAGADGSKTMVLVYNLRDPADIYHRFGGAEGTAYLVGGVSVQFQKYGDVTLGLIRAGVGLRLGANVGYLKYTPYPTWNPL